MARNGALDVLKIILALMVIGMHAGFLTDISDVAAYLNLNGLFRIAVPIFLLINGYFFYQVASSESQLIWFKRVALLYIVWMAVYLPYWIPDIHSSSLLFIARTVWALFFGVFHLWYLAGMLGAAALVVVLSRKSSRWLGVIAFLAFLVGVGIQYAANYGLVGDGQFAKTLKLEWAARNFLFFSFPFFSLGYLIRKHNLTENFTHRLASIFAAVGLVLLLIESAWNFYGPAAGAAFDNLASLALFCPAVFILFMKINIKSNSKELALYSTGIYLVHILVMFLIRDSISVSPTILTLATAVVSVFASYFLIRLNNKLPFVL